LIETPGTVLRLLNGRTRDMGLGALADVSLVKAREKASAAP